MDLTTMVLAPACYEPVPALATYTTPAFLPGSCFQGAEKDDGSFGSPYQLSPIGALNNFASLVQPAPALAMSLPAFLSTVVQDLETDPPSLPAALVHNNVAYPETDLPAASEHNDFVSMRGAVLALNPQANTASVSHPSTGDLSPGPALPISLVLPRGTFTLCGQP